MDYLILCGFLMAAIWLLAWMKEAQHPAHLRLALYLLAAVFAFLAGYLSGISSYAVIGALAIAIFFNRWIKHWQLAASWPVLLGTGLALLVSVLANPHPGKLNAQRVLKPVVPNPVNPVMPQPEVPQPEAPQPQPPDQLLVKRQELEKLLAQPWSTEDPKPNWPVSLLMAELCELAYLKPNLAEAELERRGFHCQTIEDGSMNGYVAAAGESAVVILRGTETKFYDVLQDLYFIPSFTADGVLHRGFAKGYNGMHEQVRDLLKNKFRAKRVWITGHSLGGALSVVCAYQLLQDNEVPLAGVMTFGQPMVINQQFSKSLEPKLREKYVHYVHRYDPVPNLLEPYVHFGHLVWLKDDLVIRSADGKKLMKAGAGAPDKKHALQPMSKRQLEKLLRDAKRQAPNFKPSDQPLYGGGGWIDFQDHSIANYIRMVDLLNRSEFALPQEYTD